MSRSGDHLLRASMARVCAVCPAGVVVRPGTLNFLLKILYHVDGEDISPEEVTLDQGWRSAGVRRVGAKTRTADSNAASPQPRARRSESGNDIKIAIRLRGGLDISKIGAVTVADAMLAAAGNSQEDICQDTLCPNHENASRYVRMRQILISEKVHELSACETAPHSTCKGVICNIPLQDGPDVIDAKIFNANNPLALAAKSPNRHDHRRVRRASKSTCAIRAAASAVAPTCASLSVTRFDVAVVPLAPMSNINVPPSGGQHLTVHKKCVQRFKIPYIVRCRRSERAEMAGAATADEFQASFTLSAQRRGRSHSRSRSKGRSGFGGRSASRGRSGSRSKSRGWVCSRGRSGSRPCSSSKPGHDTSGWIRSRSRTPTARRSKKPMLSWADMARGRREAPRGDDLLRDSHLTNELEKLRRVNEHAPEHRAVKKIQEDETIKLLSELDNAVANMQASVVKL
ncbi:hypothetical protein HPB49_003771 [Dermacentor silvarum]|uniref:Uncharacterized protein n=1 Tax=Dermacentor silvarum TaxID=543639 RepID=A0ACB8DTZ9_DERSI|nr:hypothetical protein HPB49_003771 [Dermacentor silvarum]